MELPPLVVRQRSVPATSCTSRTETDHRRVPEYGVPVLVSDPSGTINYAARSNPMGGPMLDQFLDQFRKSSDAALQLQQDLLRQWTQQWMNPPPGASTASTEWGRTFQKRWFEFAIEMLNRQRESIDSAYRVGIQLIEQTAQASEAKSPEEQRRAAEELWKKLFDSLKVQQDTQFQDFQKWTEKSFEFAQSAAQGVAQGAPG
jgi:hypothetical protein